MDIFLIILGVINIILVIFLIAKKSGKTEPEMPRELSERLIRIESELDKLTPKISNEFRENRKELSDNFQIIQKTVDTRVKTLQDENTKKLEELRETVD